MKLTAHHVRGAWSNFKGMVGRGYHEAHKFANSVDRGLTVAKQIYGIVEPLISGLTGGIQNPGLMRALGTYEDIRSKAIAADTVGRDTLGRINQVAPGLL